MPTYVYQCDACEHCFEIVQKMQDKAKRKCVECGKYKLYRVPQLPMVAIKLAKSEIKTLGHLASRNRETMGHDTLQEREAKDQESYNRGKPKKKEVPWWRDPNSKGPDKSLANLTPEQKQKYVITGEK
jgi:putative FmdB family regulatory protein